MALLHALLLCLFTLQVQAASTQAPRKTSLCKVAISEVHVPATSRAFIEIYQYCSSRKSGPKTTKALRGYKLLLASHKPQQLVMVVDLGHEDFKFRDEEQFYVVYTATTASGGFNPGTPPIQSVSADKTKFPVEAGQSYSLLLVKSTALKAKDFKLTRMYGNVFQPRPMDPFMMAAIKENIVDFWSICSRPSCNNVNGPAIDNNPLVNYIGSLKEAWEKIEGFPVSTDSSVNYCGPNGINYDPSHLMLSSPTPGDPNACQAGRVITPASNFRTEEQSTAKSTAGIPAARFVNPLSVLAINGVRTTRKREQSKEALLHTLPDFDDATMKQCSNHLPDGGALTNRQSIRSWLQVTKAQETCCFKCKVCEKFFALGFRPDLNKARKRQKITETGICSGNPVNNHQAIMDHTSDQIHKIAIDFFNKLEVQPSEYASIAADYDMTEYQLYKPTINMMRLAYTEIISDTPFSGHATFVSSLKLMEVNLGTHHFDSPGALAIARTFSEEFHLTLLKHLTGEENPFSLIADGSHDNANNHLFCVIFQTLERNQPVLYFYRLIHLKKGEKSADIVDALLEKIDEDDNLVPGFKKYFLNSLYGIASDGASVMTGVRVSVHAKLKSLTKRSIVLSKCMAHSLELSTKHAIKGVAKGGYLESMEDKANKIYTYYMSRGSQRWLRLNDVGKTMNVAVKRFKAHYPVRWSSSHYEVMKSLLSNFYVALVDTKNAKEDKKTPAKARLAATKIYNILSNKHFPVYLNELVDYLAVYKELSLELEKSKGTLIGKCDTVKRGLHNIDSLRTACGQSLTTFLKSCNCPGVCSETCNLNQYEACKEPRCSEFTLVSSSDVEKSSILSSIRENLYKRSALQLKEYFDFDRLEAYNILDWSKPCQPNDLQKFCSFQSWGFAVCNEFKSQFSELSNAIRRKDSYRELLQREPIDVWTAILNDGSLKYSPFLNETLRGVLSLPVSSADAERVFSMVNKVKSKERSRLTPENLEHIIRIKMNGPKNLNNLDALDYVRVFLKNHVRSDDSSVGIRPKSADGDSDTYLVPSQIF